MQDLFSDILRISTQGGIVILAVTVLRLLLKKAPKRTICLLWLLAAMRLLVPIQIESSFSLQPELNRGWEQSAAQLEDTYAQGRGEILDAQGNVLVSKPLESPSVSEGTQSRGEILDKEGTVLAGKPLSSGQAAAEASPDWEFWIPYIWLSGVAALALVSLLSYWHLKETVRDCVILSEGVWACGKIDTAFVLGFFRPQIYLPLGLTEQEQAFVIAHERSHIARRDQWWKLLGYSVLALHWFNPLVWLGYVLLCRDLEMACDEAVVSTMDLSQRKAYSAALVSCSAVHRSIAACPVAFAEVSVKERVKNVLNYRKPGFWITLAAAIAAVFLAVFFLTSPAMTEEEALQSLYQQIEEFQNSEEKHIVMTIDMDSEFGMVTGQRQERWAKGEDWYLHIDYETPMGSFVEGYMQLDGIQYAMDHSEEIDGFENRPWAALPEENYMSEWALQTKDFTQLEVLEIRKETGEDGGAYTIVLKDDAEPSEREKRYEATYTFRLDSKGKLLGFTRYVHQNIYMSGFGKEGFFDTKSLYTFEILDFDMAEFTQKTENAWAEITQDEESAQSNGNEMDDKLKEKAVDSLYAELEKMQSADDLYLQVTISSDGEYDYFKDQTQEYRQRGDNWYRQIMYETKEGTYWEHYLQNGDIQYVCRESEEIPRLESLDWTVMPEEYELELYPLLTRDWTQCEILEVREEKNEDDGGAYTVLIQGELENTAKTTYYEHTHAFHLDENFHLVGVVEYSRADRYLEGFDGTFGRFDMETWSLVRFRDADPAENEAEIRRIMEEIQQTVK